jgi:multidrug efflux pump subunit AcrB
MNLARLAVDNSRITIMAILVLILMGVSLFLSYPSAEDPSITIREATVTASFPGMAPERAEDLLGKPIEAAMREIAEIDEIHTTAKTGSVRVKLTIRNEISELDPVFQDIRNKANDLKLKLPQGTSGPFVFDDGGLTAIATIALWSDGFSMAEMHDAAKDLRDKIYTLKGVRRVEFYGVQEDRIYMETQPARMAELGISLQQVFGALAQQNIIEPGGQIVADGRSVLIEPSGALGSVDEIGAVVFALPDGKGVLRLDEIVTISREPVDPPESPSFFNDRPAIFLAVSTVTGTNNVAFGDEIVALINDAQQDLPIGMVLEFATYQPELIAAAVDGAISNVYQTLAIVLTVVMVFLGLRTGLIVGSFVPLTMLLGVIVMRMLDVELQRMSIAATIIALGLLVDNAIVVAEDIRVRLGRGTPKRQAALESGRTLAIPLLTSSMTTVFAFGPMLLVEGAAGEYVRSLAQVVAILLLGSWLLAMTVTPAMCVWFMKPPRNAIVPDDNGVVQAPAYDSIVYRIYRGILGLFLRFRYIAIALLVLLLVGAVQVLGFVKTEFFPLGDRNQFLVYVDFESGTDIRETQTELGKLTEWLADETINPEITSHMAHIGHGGPRFFLALSPLDPDPHRAFLLVNTRSVDDVSPVIARVNAFMDNNLPGAVADAKRMWFGGTEPGLLKFRLIGPNGEVLSDAANKVMAALYKVPGTVGIKHDWDNKILNLIVDVDQTRARRAGISSTDVADALETVFSGKTISDFRDGDTSVPIVLRGDDSLRFSLSGLQRMQVYSATSDQFVALDQVATVRGEWRFGQIKRFNQQRTMTIQARNPRLPSAQLLAEMLPVLDGLGLPTGYRYEIAGEVADQGDANSSLFGLLPMALAGIIILLVGQFNSFRKGFVILATIPLILIGGTIGLVVMNAPYGFMVLLGFFSLAGILINNGIVLIDRIQTEEEAGRDRLDAVVTACLGRLQPILLATLTTVLGLIPLILFGGALFYGMASVIAFGLIVATVFTLGFVPALYTILFRVPTRTALSAARLSPQSVR